jgi:tetratricopeptide (TPR) repeat protein
MRNRGILIALMMVLLGTAASFAEEKPQNNAAGFIDLGIKFYAKMRYEKAGDCFSEAKRLGPDRRQKGLLCYALKTIEANSEQLKRIEEVDRRLQVAQANDKKLLTEELMAAHLDLGRRLLEKDGYTAIIKSHFDYIISQDPVNLEACLYLGNINYLSMAYEEAIKNYKKALEVYSDNPFFWQRLGDIYVGVGNYDEAGRCYAEAIKLFRRSHLEDRNEKVRYLRKLSGRLPAVLDDIKKLMDEKRYDDVVTLCKKRAAMNPSDVTAITYMGIAMEEQGRWRQAKGLYETAIKRSPDYPTPRFYLARIYLLKERDPEAAIAQIKIFKEGIRDLLDKDKQAREALIAAQHTLVYLYHEILRDYKAAVHEGKYLLELAPEDQEAHYNLALSYAYLDKKTMACEELKKAVDINPDSKVGRAAKDMIEYLRSSSSLKSIPYLAIDK